MAHPCSCPHGLHAVQQSRVHLPLSPPFSISSGRQHRANQMHTKACRTSAADTTALPANKAHTSAAHPAPLLLRPGLPPMPASSSQLLQQQPTRRSVHACSSSSSWDAWAGSDSDAEDDLLAELAAKSQASSARTASRPAALPASGPNAPQSAPAHLLFPFPPAPAAPKSPAAPPNLMPSLTGLQPPLKPQVGGCL
jgi:hypothetical protein